MNIIDTKNPKIKFGEGDIFDVEAWGCDGIVAVINKGVPENKQNPHRIPYDYMSFMKKHPEFPCKTYDHSRPHCPILKKADVRPKINKMLDYMLAKHCKRIGVFGSQISDGTFVEGARETYEAVKEWVEEHGDAIDSITLVDLNGDYNQFLEI